MPFLIQSNSIPTRSRYIYFTVLLASLSIALAYRRVQSYRSNVFESTNTHSTSAMSNSPHLEGSSRTPVYFLSVGGPNFMENTQHPAYAKMAAIGQEITTKVKPKAIVVFSAHWQDGPNSIKINVAEETDIIYDFYGFPTHYYEHEFPNKGSPEVAEMVIGKLEGAGIEVERVKRGLDHGVWAGFIIAFDPKKNPLNVPIVQVSLFDSEDTDQHYRMGQALESLRDEGILIVGAGMSVHNLRDFRATRGTGGAMPQANPMLPTTLAIFVPANRLFRYAFSFDEALKEAATAKPEERQARMLALMKRSDARKAHPTLDHILPIHVAAGAAGADVGKQLWTLPEGSLGWAQYRFGEVAAT